MNYLGSRAFVDPFEFWRRVCRDFGCYSIAANINSINDIKVFGDYAQALAKGKFGVLPPFVEEDLKRTDEYKVHNALIVLSRLSSPDAESAPNIENAYVKFLNNNNVCADRLLDTIKWICNKLSYAEICSVLFQAGIIGAPAEDLLSEILWSGSNYHLEMITRYLLTGVFEGTLSDGLSWEVVNYNREFDWYIKDLPREARKKAMKRLNIAFDDCLIPTERKRRSCSLTRNGITVQMPAIYKKISLMNPHDFAFLGGRLLIAWCHVFDYCLEHISSTPLWELRDTAKQWMPHFKEYYDEYLSECNAVGINKATVPIDTHGKYEKLSTRRERFEFIRREDNAYTNLPSKPYKRGYTTVNLGTVPKTFDSVRTITPVSIRLYCDTYYESNAMKYALEKSLPQHFCFRDQTIQWRRLMQGWRSADASSASDLVDLFQTVACFPAIWKTLVERRPVCVKVGESYATLCMYGAMGHTFTFPVENGVFVIAAIAFGLFLCTYYGDDGTFKPVPQLERKVKELYLTYGWKLNQEKSFLRDDDHCAEACGVFKFGNTYSRMFRWTRKMTPETNVENVASCLSMQHCAEVNGWRETSDYLASCLTDLGITPAHPRSRAPYCVWKRECPTTVQFEGDKVFVVQTVLRMHYPSAANVDDAFFDEYKHYMIRQAPQSVLAFDYRNRVDLDISEIDYRPMYDRPNEDDQFNCLKDRFDYGDVDDQQDNSGLVDTRISFRGPISYDSLVQSGSLRFENRRVEEVNPEYLKTDGWRTLSKVSDRGLSI